jgi:hypothetical protein
MSMGRRVGFGLLAALVVAGVGGGVVLFNYHGTSTGGRVEKALAAGRPSKPHRRAVHSSTPPKELTVCGVPVPSTAAIQQSTFAVQTSASINPTSPTDFSSCAFRLSVLNLKGEGADEVTLVVPYQQDGDTTSLIEAGPITPSQASLVSAIQFVRSLGMRVMLNFHDDLANGSWRAFVNASDRSTWFANYGAILDHLGVIGEQEGVSEICIGTELYDMTSTNANPGNGPAWLQMIANLRRFYKGDLTYGGQRPGAYENETTSLSFWPEMSQIGIDAYYPLGTTCDPTVASMVSEWEQINTEYFEPLIAKYHKPILFTELGFSSVNCDNLNTAYFGNGGYYPGNGLYDGTVQANLFEALFETFAPDKNFAGISVWFWYSTPAASYPGDLSYSTYRKPAGDVIKKWFDLLDQRTPSQGEAGA